MQRLENVKYYQIGLRVKGLLYKHNKFCTIWKKKTLNIISGN